MSRHKVFCAFGAYAANISDPSTTLIMPMVNAKTPVIDANTKFVTLNLHKRLNNVDWDEAIMDTTGLDEDSVPLGNLPKYPPFGAIVNGKTLRGINLLTVGPVFPGQHQGGIYLEHAKFFAEVRPVFDRAKTAWPQPEFVPYELMSSALLVGGKVLRYHGFHATVVESVGSKKKLSVKQSSGVPVMVTVDLTDRTMCDDPALLTESILDPAHVDQNNALLTPQSEAGAQGAVFLALSLCVSEEISGPKEPIGGGGV